MKFKKCFTILQVLLLVLALCLVSGGCGGGHHSVTVPQDETENEEDNSTQSSVAWVGTWTSTLTVESGDKSESADVAFSLEKQSSAGGATVSAADEKKLF